MAFKTICVDHVGIACVVPWKKLQKFTLRYWA